MSFSSKVKKELAGHISNATHCRIAEIAAIISMCGSVLIDVDEKYSIRVRTETDSTAEKFKTLVWKTFHIDAKIVVKKNAYSKNAETYTITIKDHNQAMKVLEATKLIDDQGQIGENLSVTNNVVIMKDCCKRAFIRGAFMAAGTEEDFRIGKDDNPMVTTVRGINGAIAMFYPGVQEELAELTGGDYYVAFSSVDGAMIHSVDGIQPRDLLWRLKCTRSMMTEGLLSKYVYKYNSEKKQLEQMYL